MADHTIELLKQLVEINSINPSLVSDGAGEAEIARAVEAEMRSVGMDVEVTEVTPGRPNVVGVLEGRGPGKALMYCGHLDTVGVQGMDRPFEPAEHGDKIYGRGSGDMKGGLAAMLGAARAVAENDGLKNGRLIVAAVVDEEYKSVGAEALVKQWRADAAVVTEPTGLVVATGHKGFSWVEVVTEGRAAHGSMPREGRDAILRMGRVLSYLEILDLKLQSIVPHPLLGTPSLHASIIGGGREMSTYPDKCTLHLERRTIVGEQSGIALQEVEDILARLKLEDSEFEASAQLLFERTPFETPVENTLPLTLESALDACGRNVRRGGMPYWTDAAILGCAGIPSVVFGPGGAGYHGLEEYVIASEVIACREVLTTLAREFCV